MIKHNFYLTEHEINSLIFCIRFINSLHSQDFSSGNDDVDFKFNCLNDSLLSIYDKHFKEFDNGD